MNRVFQVGSFFMPFSKVVCSPYALDVAGGLKALIGSCLKQGILPVPSQAKRYLQVSAPEECPLPDSVIKKIAGYPVCVEGNAFWGDLDESEESEAYLRWMDVIREMAIQYGALLATFRASAVLIFQGYLLDDAVLRYLAVQRGLKVISIERTLRNDRLLWESISGVTVNRNQGFLHYWREEDLVESADVEASVDSYLSGIKNFKLHEHSSPERVYSWEGEKPKVLFLGQVYTDSSLLYGLSGFENPIDVIGGLFEWLEKNDATCLIKLHPKEHCGKNPLTHQSYKDVTYFKIRERYGDLLNSLGDRLVIDFENRYDTYSLIQQSDLVVTVNSQAGLESAVMGKAVVHGRQCFYGGLGFTYDYSDSLDFSLRLDQALSVGPPSVGDARKFFHVFYNNFCIPKSSKHVASLVRSVL
jgi:hypothetical protein